MRRAAHRYGAGVVDEERWAITGLLHDADYDQWPDEHPRRIVDWLREQGEEESAYAVSFHQTKWNLPPKSVKKKLKDKAFAAKVDREIIKSSVELMGVDMDGHIQFVIDALKPHADELGIAGKT